jgi:hypothetical protein
MRRLSREVNLDAKRSVANLDLPTPSHPQEATGTIPSLRHIWPSGSFEPQVDMAYGSWYGGEKAVRRCY